MQRKEFVSRSEQQALTLLERVLEGHGRKVYVGPRLQRIVREEPRDKLTSEERQLLHRGEVDFAVVNTEGGYNVEFAVEFDGPHHQEPAQQKRDRIKDRLLFSAGVPLVRVPGRAISEREQMTILEWIGECFLTWKREQTAIAGEAMDLMHDNPSIHPLVARGIGLFRLVPFKPIETVAERLRDRYGIQYGTRPYDRRGKEPDATRAAIDEWVKARYVVVDLNLVGPDDWDDEDDDRAADDQLGADLAAMKRGKPGDVPDVYRLAVLERVEKEEFSHPFTAEVPIDWPVQDLGNQTLTAAQTGTWLWAVELTLAQYLALRQIEAWAERTLMRLDRP